ncbi:MAG: helix-turn-helix transcriptional regulator [bacterium]|nr:MAG: helix-turn-helix transcriptional regulator [bacterium]
MGIAERREREKEQRRQTILDAAEKIFFSRGMAQATMEEVSETAELSKGTLYLYFKSKEELYFGISCRALSLLKKMFEEAVQDHTSGVEKIRAIGRAYYQYSQKYPDYFNMIIHYETSRLGNLVSEAVLMQCHELGRGVMEVVASSISTGLRDKSVRADLDPIRTAYLLQGVSTGIIQLIAREQSHIEQFEKFSAGDLMEDFMDMMHHALKSNGILTQQVNKSRSKRS